MGLADKDTKSKAHLRPRFWFNEERIEGIKMADISDIVEELARIKAEGKTPKKIYVGTELFSDLSAQQNDVWGGSFESVQRTSNNEVTEYKGIPIELKEMVPRNYLEIETY